MTYTVTNQGTATATATWYDTGYLSADGVLDNSDQMLSGFATHSTNLAGGASYGVSSTLITSSSTAAGSYTLFVKADGRGPQVAGTITDAGYVTETNEANNKASSVVVLP